MKMDKSAEAAVTDALTEVCIAAKIAQTSPDLEAAKVALNRVWNAVHDAQALITKADNETRRAALARLGEFA
jgi:hypothetical protein